ncbi:MAG: DUF4124 domain-containing protein [Steroidobacteraceae bacterium]
MTPEAVRFGAVLTVLGLILCPAGPGWSGEVYKSIDAQGHVVYSDHPETGTEQKSEVKVEGPNPTEAARIAKEQAILKVEEIQRNKQKSVEDAKKAQADRTAQVQCDSARNRYYSLKDARRLYDRDADGNRVYLSDQDGDARREAARQAMAAACGG